MPPRARATSSRSTDAAPSGGLRTTGAAALVGRRVRLSFGAVDATPDLAAEGPVTAVVGSVRDEPSVGGAMLEGRVEAPALLAGLLLRAWARYEDEPVEGALEGRAPTVNASIEAENGVAVAGGLATLALAP